MNKLAALKVAPPPIFTSMAPESWPAIPSEFKTNAPSPLVTLTTLASEAFIKTSTLEARITTTDEPVTESTVDSIEKLPVRD